MGELTDRDRELLDFAALTWRPSGAREAETRARFGLSAASYEEWIRALVEQPEALAHDPVTVNRIRRMEARRATAGSWRSVAG